MEISQNQQVRQHLEILAEPELARFSSALIPDLSRRMLGVRLPRLRAYARDLAKADWQTIIGEGLTDATFEEVMLHGFILGYADMPWHQRWEAIKSFVVWIDNWSVCDSCCATYKFARKHRVEIWSDLLDFLHSDQEYFQRFAIVMMLDHFMDTAFIPQVLKVWRTVQPHGFYVEMALGWGLSVAFLSAPEQTLEVLRDETVAAECRRKACQKILESRRTPEHWRPVIRNLKSHIPSSNL